MANPSPSLPPISPGGINFTDLSQMLGTDAPIILDIGANNGSTTLEFLHHFADCTIYAFEPDQRALWKFKSRINHPRVHIFEMAIGAQDGEANFHISSGMPPSAAPSAFALEFPRGWDMSSSLRKPKTHQQVWPWCKFESTRKVSVRRLDTWAREAGVSRIYMIWADIQGAEGDLVLGGRESLSKTRYLYTEYSNDEWYEGQPNLGHLAEMLDNFSIIRRFHMDVLFKNNAL
jgi:FkbM family methyltransferase